MFYLFLLSINELSSFKLYLGNSIHQDSNSLVQNFKNKTKRLNQSGLSSKKNIQSLVSTSKKVMSNNPDINKIIDQQLFAVQQKPAIPKPMSFNSYGVYNICFLLFNDLRKYIFRNIQHYI